jgi:hypothetical protein
VFFLRLFHPAFCRLTTVQHLTSLLIWFRFAVTLLDISPIALLAHFSLFPSFFFLESKFHLCFYTALSLWTIGVHFLMRIYLPVIFA